jgi:hypothetical protein
MNIRRFDYRIVIGLILVIGGLLALLDQMGILKGATNIFWAGIWAIGAVIFLIWFFSDRSKWWAAIPGFTLAGLAVSTLIPSRFDWDGLAFLGGMGVGFWAVYLSKTARWWAIIPGGILITMGITSALTSAFQATDTGGIFLMGLGITFLLVALLAKMRWAYIPAAVLLLIGFFIGAPFAGVADFIWIGLLLVAGVILLISAIRR